MKGSLGTKMGRTMLLAIFIATHIAPGLADEALLAQVNSQFDEAGQQGLEFDILDRVTSQTEGSLFVRAKSMHDNGRLEVEGLVSLFDGSVEYNYTFVDGLALMDSANQESGDKVRQCVPPSSLPFFSQLRSSLREAEHLPQDEASTTLCSENAFAVTWGEDVLVLCADRDGKIVRVYNRAVILDLVPSHRNYPLDSRSVNRFCYNKANEENKLQQQRPLRDELTVDLAHPQEEIQNMTHDCFFLHGAGKTENLPPANSYKEYWGDLDSTWRPPYCKTTTFWRLDTRTVPWSDEKMQKYLCEMTADSDGVIRNKMLFTHSMAGLVLAAAIENKHCSLGTSSGWYQVQSPFKGSKAASLAHSICESTCFLCQIPQAVLQVFGYCIPASEDKMAVNHAYSALLWHERAPDSLREQYKTLTRVARDNLSGALCGTSLFGLTSKSTFIFGALDELLMDPEWTDGLVSASSCHVVAGAQEWKADFRSPFYTAAINHSDGTCRNSDGWFGIHRKPCSWYRFLKPPQPE